MNAEIDTITHVEEWTQLPGGMFRRERWGNQPWSEWKYVAYPPLAIVAAKQAGPKDEPAR